MLNSLPGPSAPMAIPPHTLNCPVSCHSSRLYRTHPLGLPRQPFLVTTLQKGPCVHIPCPSPPPPPPPPQEISRPGFAAWFQKTPGQLIHLLNLQFPPLRNGDDNGLTKYADKDSDY